MTDRIAYPDTWSHDARRALDDMFETARREHLWFFHGGLSGPVWLSPDELQAEQEKGSFLWGAPNWTLRHPFDRIHQLVEQRKALDAEIDNVLARSKSTLRRA